eukprot:460327-Pleurochrysis_carterae.AAC.1
MDESNNTGWLISDRTPAPDNHLSADVMWQMEKALRSKDLANKLCFHLLGPNGAVDVERLKELYYTTVSKAVENAGLD